MGKTIELENFDDIRFGIIRYGLLPDGNFKAIEEMDEDKFLKEVLKTMDYVITEMVSPYGIKKNKKTVNQLYEYYGSFRQILIYAVKIGMDEMRDKSAGKLDFNSWMKERHTFLEDSVQKLKSMVGLK